MHTKKSNPPEKDILYKVIKGINGLLKKTRTKKKREEIIQQVKETFDQQFLEHKNTDKFTFFITFLFKTLPELVGKTKVEIHKDLESYLLDEVFDSANNVDKLLCFVKVLFPRVEAMGLLPMASERIIYKCMEVVSEDAISSITGTKIKPIHKNTLKNLLLFLNPHIEKAKQSEFASQPVIIEDSEGKPKECGTQWHALHLLQEVLEKLAA